MYNFSIPFTRGRWKVLCAVALATLLLAVLSMSVGTTPAHAASKSRDSSLVAQTTPSQCYAPLSTLGNPIKSTYISLPDGTQIGELDVYYTNGYNCAYFQLLGPALGTQQWMLVGIQGCQEQTAGNTCTETAHDVWEGKYSHYIGPVGVYAQKHCITAIGAIIWKGKQQTTITNPRASLCN